MADPFDYERRREGLPIIPTLITSGVGVVQGLIASMDVDAWATDPANTAKIPGQAPPLGIKRSKTLWLDGGAVALGVLGLAMDWHEDISEPLLGAGSFGFASTLAFHLAQSGKTAPANAQALLGARVGAPAMAGARASTAAGYMKQEAAGVL